MSFVIAAPSSGSGKTTVTLGLLRALSQDGVDVRGAKSGPDYIDPQFHAAACKRPCLNLDAWAMSEQRIRALAGGVPTIIEGAMGLFDGAPPVGKGSCADLARILELPVVLVVDCCRIAQSVAAIVSGFANFDPSVRVSGVILNRVGSARHAEMLRRALAHLDISVIGALPRNAELSQPSRHLGLVQAGEREDLEQFLDQAAEFVRQHLDFTALPKLTHLPESTPNRLRPPAQRIAVAQDRAFAFSYPHMLRDWHAMGATITRFSPLNDEEVPSTDFVFLPGGYPELHAGTLAANMRFLNSLRNANAEIYGECGGYMTLGEGLVDAQGNRHQMAGLLPLETSFEKRRLHLGYRQLCAKTGPFAGSWSGHEFHYATTVSARGPALFVACDASGAEVSDMGLCIDNISGSFAHVIDTAPEAIAPITT